MQIFNMQPLMQIGKKCGLSFFRPILLGPSWCMAMSHHFRPTKWTNLTACENLSEPDELCGDRDSSTEQNTLLPKIHWNQKRTTWVITIYWACIISGTPRGGGNGGAIRPAMLDIFDSPYGQRMSANFASPGFSPVQRRKVPYQQQQQRCHLPAQSSTPRYNANWSASPTTPYSPYTYKSVQHMVCLPYLIFHITTDCTHTCVHVHAHMMQQKLLSEKLPSNYPQF